MWSTTYCTVCCRNAVDCMSSYSFLSVFKKRQLVLLSFRVFESFVKMCPCLPKHTQKPWLFHFRTKKKKKVGRPFLENLFWSCLKREQCQEKFKYSSKSRGVCRKPFFRKDSGLSTRWWEVGLFTLCDTPVLLQAQTSVKLLEQQLFLFCFSVLRDYLFTFLFHSIKLHKAFDPFNILDGIQCTKLYQGT